MTTITTTGSVQTYTVQTTGIYAFIVQGAQGGSGDGGLSGGGGGATISANITLSQGTVIDVVIGAQGAAGGANGGGGGGGGGTYVYTTGAGAALLLDAGGGGGGGGWSSNGVLGGDVGGTGGQTTTSGLGGNSVGQIAQYQGAGGTGGNAGTGGTDPANIGRAAAGGSGYLTGTGEVGGGGSFETGGGGGGYSGGGGGGTNAGGGGGGSFVINTATSVTEIAGNHTGSGFTSIALATTLSLSASNSTPTFGQTVTLTATVSNIGNALHNLTGESVTFFDGFNSIGSALLDGNGVATLSTSALSAGAHNNINAVYTAHAAPIDTMTAVGTAGAVTVAPLTTTTQLTVSNATRNYGQSETLTATVKSGGVALTTLNGETVTFYDGVTSLGTGTLNGSGVATLTTSALTGGIHNAITAVYAGDTNDATSTSSASTVTINQLSTVNTLTLSSATPTYGQTVTLTATIDNGTAPASTLNTETVTFKEGATVLGTGTINSLGVATLSLSNLSVGSHSNITATYGGDTNDAPSVSLASSLSVQQVVTTTTLTTSNASPVVGSNVTLTAIVASGGQALTTLHGETVTFYDGLINIGTGTINSLGVATLTTNALSVGSHTNITAKYAGDTNDATSTSTSVSETVSQLTTTTLLSASNATPTVGDNLTLTATIEHGSTPLTTLNGQTVTFYDGLTNLGTGTINSQGVATLTTNALSVGSHSNITAVYAGDTNDATSTSVTSSVTVGQIHTSTVLTPSASPISYGLNEVLTATVVSGGQPMTTLNGETVTFYDGTTSLGTATIDSNGVATFSTNTLSIGLHNNLTAVYAGDTNVATSTSSASAVEVDHAAIILTGASNVNFYQHTNTPVIVDNTLTFIDSVPSNEVPNTQMSVRVFIVNPSDSSHEILSFSNPTPGANSTYGYITGNFSNGVLVLTSTGGVSTLNQWDAAVQAVTYQDNATHPTAGVRNIGISYNDGVFPATSDTASDTVTVVPYVQTSTNLVASISTPLAGQDVTLTATITDGTHTLTGISSGAVTFYDGQTNLGTGNITNGVATLTTNLLTVGSHTNIYASFAGDDGDSASNSSGSPITVAPNGPVAVTVNGITYNLYVTTQTEANPVIPFDAAHMPWFTPGSLNGQGAAGSFDSQFVGATGGTGSINGVSNVIFAYGNNPGNNNAIYGDEFFQSLHLGFITINNVYQADASPGVNVPANFAYIVPINTTTTVTPSNNQITAGQSLTLTANVTDGNVNYNFDGTVSFYDGPTLLGSASIYNGPAAITTSGLSVGAHPITAVYSGNSADASSISNISTVVVSAANAGALTTNTLLTATPTSANAGSNITLSASVQSGGVALTTLNGEVVTFRDGSTVLGTANLNTSGVATLVTNTLNAGTHNNITAVYSGDANDSTSTSLAATVTVAQLITATGITPSITAPVYGQNITLTANVQSGGNPLTTIANEAIIFKDGATTIGTAVINGNGIATLTTNSLSVGTHSQIKAFYGGDTNDVASTSIASATVTVGQINTTTVLTPSTTTPSFGQNVTLTATVQNGGVALTTLNGEQVTFKDGATTLGTGTLNANGVATFTTNTLALGAHNSLTAVYAGDTNDAASTSSTNAITVGQVNTATVLSASSTTPTINQNVTLTATIQNGGVALTTLNGEQVTFKDGATTIGTGTLNANGVATFITNSLTLGAHGAITAAYGGDTNDIASVSSALALNVLPVGGIANGGGDAGAGVPSHILIGNVIASNAQVTGSINSNLAIPASLGQAIDLHLSTGLTAYVGSTTQSLSTDYLASLHTAVDSSGENALPQPQFTAAQVNHLLNLSGSHANQLRYIFVSSLTGQGDVSINNHADSSLSDVLVVNGTNNINPSALNLSSFNGIALVGSGVNVSDINQSNAVIAQGNASYTFGAGSQTLILDGVNATITGGQGIDTVVLTKLSQSDASIALGPNGSIQISSQTSQAVANLNAVDRVQFSDGSVVAFDTKLGGHAGDVFRLYQAAFDRAPDLQGIGYWIAQLDKGVDLVQVTQAFEASPEFINLYGANSTTNTFVNLLYQNVLHRAPDASGLNYWITQMHVNGDSPLMRAYYLEAFSASNENIANVVSAVSHGIAYQQWLA